MEQKQIAMRINRRTTTSSFQGFSDNISPTYIRSKPSDDEKAVRMRPCRLIPVLMRRRSRLSSHLRGHQYHPTGQQQPRQNLGRQITQNIISAVYLGPEGLE